MRKSYLSWHWIVIQGLKKNWLVVSNMTWGIWWILTQPLKSLKILFQWAFFCLMHIKFELKKIQRSYLSWTCSFKNGMRNWVNFHYSIQKSERLSFDGLFLPKAYNASARKFHRNYVSRYWRVMQNLKESWHVAWKMTKYSRVM